MKITKLLLICLCCLLVAPAVVGQAAKTPTKPGILGYLDPQTGAFRPVPQASDDDDAETKALTTFTGTITVTFTVTVKSTGLTTYWCSAEVSVLDQLTTSARSYSESGTAAATGTGTTRTCKVTIPYAWALGTQASDTMTTTYVVFGTAGTGSVTQRTTGLSPLDSRKVPANGATTALTANVTI
jgi:hypothetical protein